MRRWRSPFATWSHERKANGLASAIALTALAILYLEMPPTPAGADAIRRVTHHKAMRPIIALPVSAEGMASIGPTSGADLDFSTVDPTEHAVRKKLALLERGRTFLESIPDYTAQFVKQELVNGELLDEQSIFFKCRHQPFSVYLKWESGDEGREVLYCDGANEGDMIVHGGGWKARLPSLSIAPTNALALRESRYPITNVGLLELVKTMLQVHAADLTKKNIARSEQLNGQEFDGRPCFGFLVEYRDASSSPTYRKSVVLIDQEWHVPVYTRNFGWPDTRAQATGDALDEATLIEFYSYADLRFRQQLAAADFDRTNEDYRFR